MYVIKSITETLLKISHKGKARRVPLRVYDLVRQILISFTTCTVVIYANKPWQKV